MKQTNKLSLASIKIKSFTTSLTEKETYLVKGGSNECIDISENIINCLSSVSGLPKCIKNNEDPN